MTLTHHPLLHIQLKLQTQARGRERFQQYLRTLSADGRTLDLPPLGLMNPMGKEHVTALLEEYLTLGAEGVAAAAVTEVMPQVADVPGDFNVGLVLVDDLKGGWTNRWDYEFNLRFGPGPRSDGEKPRWLKDWWLTAILWSSEPASTKAVREAVLTTVQRAGYLHRHGPARNLREMLRQEGEILLAAGCTGPTLNEEDLAYTREVLAPFLDASDKRTVIECLFGDDAGRTLGFTPRGLSPGAGLSLALHDALMGRNGVR